MNNTSITTVLIAQSNNKIAVEIKEVLNSNLNVVVVGIVNTGKDLLSWMLDGRADIILCDIYLPFMDGIFLMQIISSFNKSSKFLFYSEFDYQWMIRKAINLGAFGFLSMKNDIKLINNAIEVIISGGTYIDDLSIVKFYDCNAVEYELSNIT